MEVPEHYADASSVTAQQVYVCMRCGALVAALLTSEHDDLHDTLSRRLVIWEQQSFDGQEGGTP